MTKANHQWQIVTSVLQIGADNTLEMLGEMISDNLEPLIDADFYEPAWRSLLRLLKTQCSEADGITFHNMPADGSARKALNAFALDEGFSLSDDVGATSGRISLPKTWDKYLAQLEGRDRKELKRKLKHALTDAGARLEIALTIESLPEAIERVLTFMRAAGGSKGMKARWTYRPLFRRALPELAAARRIEVQTLYLFDQPAAGMINFPSSKGPLIWAAGFDCAFAKWSPGIVLFTMAIQRAIARGEPCFDLLRGQMRYKKDLGATDYELRKIMLRRCD